MRAHLREIICGMVAGIALHAAGFAAQQVTVGDCDGDGVVTVDEIIVGVNIALGSAPLTDCASLDADGNGAVTVDELITAVNNALAAPSQTTAFVVATDFQTGSYATIGLDDRKVAPTTPGRQLGSDAIARVFGGLLYVVNRFGSDNIQRLDPSQDFATRWQCSTGAGSNPNDIAVVNAGKAYVALFARAQLLIVNPSPQPDCSDFVLGSIDLSAYADSDGIPDASQLAVVGDRLYVSLERLTNFVATEPGALVVIDVNTDQVLSAITLTGKDPFGSTAGLTVIDGGILVSEVGSFGVNDGGIERIDLASGTAQGYVVTEDDLGGDITDFVWVSEHLAYAIISKADFSNALVAFDPTTRMVTQTLVSSGNLADIELDDRGELFLADRSTTQPGIRIFRASDGVELTSTPLATGLPPFAIAFVE